MTMCWLVRPIPHLVALTNEHATLRNDDWHIKLQYMKKNQPQGHFVHHTYFMELNIRPP